MTVLPEATQLHFLDLLDKRLLIWPKQAKEYLDSCKCDYLVELYLSSDPRLLTRATHEEQEAGMGNFESLMRAWPGFFTSRRKEKLKRALIGKVKLPRRGTKLAEPPSEFIKEIDMFFKAAKEGEAKEEV